MTSRQNPNQFRDNLYEKVQPEKKLSGVHKFLCRFCKFTPCLLLKRRVHINKMDENYIRFPVLYSIFFSYFFG